MLKYGKVSTCVPAGLWTIGEHSSRGFLCCDVVECCGILPQHHTASQHRRPWLEDQNVFRSNPSLIYITLSTSLIAQLWDLWYV